MSKRLEHKSFAFKLEGPPDAQGSFTGYAAVFGNVDKGNDVIEPGAVTKTVLENPEVPIFWMHDYTAVPVGSGRLSRDAKGVRIAGKLFLDTSNLASEIFGAMKADAVKGLSIGYNTIAREYSRGIRHLQEIAIGEVSLCPFPMNPLAEVDGVKDLSGYDQTEGVDCLITMIAAGSNFLVSEVAEGDADAASRMQGILTSLGVLLDSEIGELAQASDDDADDAGITYQEAMSAGLDGSIKALMALQAKAPADDGVDDPRDVDPDTLSALRGLLADMTVTVGQG
jgi:HK97 family phage prohead protease